MSLVTQKIEELRQRFLRALPERVASISDTWARTRINTGSAMSRRELTTRLHALAGTAATYGLEDVSELAREAEMISETPLEMGSIESIDAIINCLRRAVEQP